MKNRMDVPKEYSPVLPGKVEAHLAKKKAQETAQDSLLTQTASAVGKVIMQLELVSPTSTDTFDPRHLTPGQFQELKFACLNHLTHLIPGIEKESIDVETDKETTH